MNRYTQKADGRWTIRPDALTPSQPGYTGEAADRLAALEELIYSLLKEQDELSESLAQLREQGRTKTTRFHQLLARKLTIGQMMSAFRAFGVISPADDA